MSKNIQSTHEEGKVLSFIPTGEFYFYKGIDAFQMGNYLLAKKYLVRALQLEPNEPMITCQLAIIYSELEDYEKSNQLLMSIINNPGKPMDECHYFLANNYAYMGLYKEAVKHANMYLSKQPTGEFADDTKELLEVLAIETDEIDENGLLNESSFVEDDLIEKHELAKHLIEERKFSEAIPLLLEIIDDYEEFWPAYNNLSLAYFHQGNKEQAKQILEKVLVENTGNLHALCNLVIFNYYEGKDISKYAEMLTTIYPISADHRYKLGVTFTIIGNYRHGFRWLKSLLKTSIYKESDYYYWLVLAAHYSNNETIAKKAWEKLIKLRPEKLGEEPWHD
ncbi:tetratricopeptide repeat protein [Bacillus kwashiorkori]|uniref:tetratricopeptide repeat protein n=1 Tax=Bacillus kwashiorkori TaxID=1522318 RepID=UPI000784066F|nr:tetratricopeptide repeat protein [Bacillus kwashiorkori]